MTQRMTSRERKRTEKTRYETRRMRLDCFIHADGSNYFEGTNQGLLEGAKFRVVVNGRWNFDKPVDMTVVDFITKLTATGNLPLDLPCYVIGNEAIWRYKWQDNQRMQKLGKVTFDYQINEWNEIHNPGMAHPWMARSWDDCGIGYKMMRDWEAPGKQILWIRPLFEKFTETFLQRRVTAHDAQLVIDKLKKPWNIAVA